MFSSARTIWKLTDLDFHRSIQLLINFISLGSSTFAMVVSIVVIFMIMNNIRKKSTKKSENVSLILTINTSFALICSSISLILMNLSSIGGDENIPFLKSIAFWACYTRGYLHFVFINAIYLSYVLQAGFRLFRIAFRGYHCLHNLHSFLFYIILQWILSFLIISPILKIHDGKSPMIVFLPKEFYCQVPMTSVCGIVFSILTVYLVPVLCIGFIYFWIIFLIYRQSRECRLVVKSVQRRNERDKTVLRRICFVILTLLSLGIPSSIFVFSFLMTGHLHWAAYRIGWMTAAISFALISISSIYVTPQIYKSLHRFLQNKSKFDFKNNRKRDAAYSCHIQKPTFV